jgi:hypothetical protein
LHHHSAPRATHPARSGRLLVFPNLALRLEPVVNRVTSLAAALRMELIGAPGNLRSHIDGFLASTGFLPNKGASVGSNTRYAISFTRSLTRNHAKA